MTEDKIIVINCGGQQAYYMARKLRAESYYCELTEESDSAEYIKAQEPKGLLLVGSDEESMFSALSIDYADLGIPVLALGTAAARLAVTHGAVHTGLVMRESAAFVSYSNCGLFTDIRESDHYFKRIDTFELPADLCVIASTAEGDMIAFGDPKKNVYAFCGYIEANDPEGLTMLHNFAEVVCGCCSMGSTASIVNTLVESIRKNMGAGNVLLPVFMSIESAVTAALISKAVGNRLKCISIDTGLLRSDELRNIENCYKNEMGLELIQYDASDRMLKKLQGVKDPAMKRRMISDEYSEILTEQFLKLPDIERVAFSTTYSDVFKGKDRFFRILLEGQEPIRPLIRMFREDIRAFADYLNIPSEMRALSPFAVEGLAVRCLAEVTADRLHLLRSAERIFHEEVEKAGYAKKIAQSFVILTDIMSHGEHGMGYVCVLRAMGSSTSGKASAYRLPYDLMENAVIRITDEVRGISRVVYDITGRPTADLEWE